MVILGGMMRGMEPEATTRTLATAMIRRDMPPTLMTLAARMKKGMAMRANLSRPAKRRWTTVSRGMAEWRTKAPRGGGGSTVKMRGGKGGARGIGAAGELWPKAQIIHAIRAP